MTAKLGPNLNNNLNENLAEEKENDVKRSRKSKMKKRPEDWEELKVSIAHELGLWDQVAQSGWAGLSAIDSGRLGGVFAARKQQLLNAASDKRGNADIESLS